MTARVIVRVNLVPQTRKLPPSTPTRVLTTAQISARPSPTPSPVPAQIVLTSSSLCSSVKVELAMRFWRHQLIIPASTDIGERDPRHRLRKLRHLRLSVGAAGQHASLPRPGTLPTDASLVCTCGPGFRLSIRHLCLLLSGLSSSPCPRSHSLGPA